VSCSLVLYALFLHRSNFYHYVDCHILTCLWRKINELNCLYFFARTLKSRFFPTNLKFAYCAPLRVAWFPLGVFAEAVGGGERAARNSCWWQGARATTRLSFLVVADTSSTASVHLGYSPPLPNKNSLFGGASFFLFPDLQNKKRNACVPSPVFPALFGFPRRATTSTMVLDFVKILALVSLAGKTLNFW
jgi:hypothetical protein